MQITASDRAVHEELEIERINDKWLYSMNVIDWETQKNLLSGKDLGFLNGPPVTNKCLPDETIPSD
jgi:hypothetical protein